MSADLIETIVKCRKCGAHIRQMFFICNNCYSVYCDKCVENSYNISKCIRNCSDYCIINHIGVQVGYGKFVNQEFIVTDDDGCRFDLSSLVVRRFTTCSYCM
jgi:hypothetical protein